MVKLFFISAALIFFLGTVNSRGVNKLVWFFTGIMFLQDRIVLVNSPTELGVHRLLIYTLLISELIHTKKFINHFKKFPLKRSILIAVIGYLAIGFFDSRNNPVLNIYRLVDDFIQTFAIIFLCYVNLEKVEDWQRLLKFFLIASLITSVYGVFNFISKSNPVDTLITNSFVSESYFNIYALYDDRFRINAFVSHPIYYGYLSGVLFLLALYCFTFKKEYKKICVLLMPLTFLNLLFSNSRTPLLATFIGLVIFILFAFEKIQRFKIAFTGCLLCIFCYNIPLVKDKVDTTIDIFLTGGEKAVGSSIDLRTTQLMASYNEFLKSPIIGNGFKYIVEDLKATDSAETNRSDDDFGGFESYIYHILIEQGLTGMIINIVFFSSLLYFFFRHSSGEADLKGLGLAISIMFLTFIIGTGSLGAWPVSMGLLGVLMKMLEIKSTSTLKSELSCCKD